MFAELADAEFEGGEILVDESETSLLPPQASISGKLTTSKARDHLFILAKSIREAVKGAAAKLWDRLSFYIRYRIMQSKASGQSTTRVAPNQSHRS